MVKFEKSLLANFSAHWMRYSVGVFIISNIQPFIFDAFVKSPFSLPLRERIKEKVNNKNKRIHYFSFPPQLFPTVVEGDF
jgi:hypothetical protein